MNWMTSGRRRVQRSQKGRELRAKHFAKVAADRARAPVSQPARAVRSSSTRQSTDVSRLKSRWTQQPLDSHAEPSPAQLDSTCPPSDVRTHGPGTTPDPSPFQPGTLELEITPPFGGPRPYDDSNGGVGGLARRGTGATISGISSFNNGGGARANGAGLEAFEGPFQDPQRSQQRLPHSTLPPAELDASSPKRARPPLGRRQLVFGGGASTADCREFGEDYEGQLLGSDAAGFGGSPGEGQAAVQPSRNGLVLEGGNVDAAAAGFRATRAVDQQERLCDQWGSSMRFFDAGVEVALDGSPVLDNAASSPPPPPLLASSCAGRLASPGNVYETVGVPSGVRGAGEMRGMPKFSIGGGQALGLDSRPLATPPESWEGALPGDADMDEISTSRLEPSASSHTGTEKGISERFQPAPLALLEDGIQPSPHRESLDASGVENVLAEQDPSNPHRSASSPAAAAGFEVLAQAWGLFGGALAASSAQGRTNVVVTSACAGSNSEGDASVEAARKAAVKETPRGRGLRDDDGGAEGGVPPLRVSVPARSTPPMASPAEHRAQATNEPNACEPSPAISGPPPSTDDHDHRIDLDDCSSSPELTMMFVEEPGQGQDMGASTRQAGDKSSEEEPQALYGPPIEPGRLATDGARGSTAPEKAPQGCAADLHARDVQDQAVLPHNGDSETLHTKEQPDSVFKTRSLEMTMDITQENGPNACRERGVVCVQEPRSSEPLVGSGIAIVTSTGSELQRPQGGCRSDGNHGGNSGGSRKSRLPRTNPKTDAGDGTVAAGNAEVSATSSQMRGSVTSSAPKTGREAYPEAPTTISDASFSSSAGCSRATSEPLALASFTTGTASIPVRGERRKCTRQGGGVQEAREGQCETGESPETIHGEAGVRESRKAQRRKSIVSAALRGGRTGSIACDNDDAGDTDGDGTERSRKQRRIGTRFDTERANSRSTIAWYRTIVACLTAAS